MSSRFLSLNAVRRVGLLRKGSTSAVLPTYGSRATHPHALASQATRFVNTISGTDDSTKQVKAWLTLEDGTVFQGISFGSETPVNGEVVFSTGMVGYTESLTDPSFRGQVIHYRE